jgi:hypothetical protein
MRPDFEKMSKADLRAYVLENREDLEALRSLMSRRSPNAIRYNFPNTEEGRAQMREVLRRKINGEL